MNFLKEIDWFPFWLSLKVAGIATVISLICGLTISYVLAKYDFWGKDWLDAIVTLPIVLPPTVLGYYLLVLMGRKSFIGLMVKRIFGTDLVFTWRAAVIAACLVSIPLLIKSSRAAIENVDVNLEKAARTLGLSETKILFKVTLPLAWRGILAGVLLAFGRALGDFGATLMVAGNIPGKTQTMPIAIYDAVQSGNYVMANVLTILVSLVAVLIMVVGTKLSKAKFSYQEFK
ncbi:MAG: molybdate ABC transporter permease subunit [Actinobacteria bacterium]|nr:molybdate ABC transporter permease subunit [Actinomycetota bacterium]